MSIEEFYTQMKGMWDEIDALDPLPTCECNGCTCNLTQKTLKSQQGRRLIQFLMKLDNKYQHTRSMILMRKKMPTAAEAYNILTQQQTHQEFSKNTLSEQNHEVPIACKVEKKRTYDNRN